MMENTYLRIILLSIGAYLLALVSSRLIGRKVISQMTFFDFVIGVTLGSVTADIVLSDHSPITGVMMLVTISVLTMIVGLSYIKSMKVRKLVNSEPVVVIDRGQIVDKNMGKIRLSLNDLLMLLRQKNCFNISDVEYAVMEITGQLSVLLKAQKQPVTASDLNIYTNYMGLTRDLVIDGRLLEENLNAANLKKYDFLTQLKSYGVNDLNDVFYAGVDCSGSLYISKRQNNYESQGKYGID